MLSMAYMVTDQYTVTQLCMSGDWLMQMNIPFGLCCVQRIASCNITCSGLPQTTFILQLHVCVCKQYDAAGVCVEYCAKIYHSYNSCV